MKEQRSQPPQIPFDFQLTIVFFHSEYMFSMVQTLTSNTCSVQFRLSARQLPTLEFFQCRNVFYVAEILFYFLGGLATATSQAWQQILNLVSINSDRYLSPLM